MVLTEADIEGLDWKIAWHGCPLCAYDEAEGELMDHCQRCSERLALIAIRDDVELDDHLRSILSERTGLNL